MNQFTEANHYGVWIQVESIQRTILHYYTRIISVLDKTTVIAPPKIIHVEEEM